jgi:hypothetical protein
MYFLKMLILFLFSFICVIDKSLMWSSIVLDGGIVFLCQTTRPNFIEDDILYSHFRENFE